MRWLFAILSFVVVMTMTIENVHGQRDGGCRMACSREYNPVCGFNGSCYRLFGNRCVFNAEKCSKQPNLSEVARSSCEEAEKGGNKKVKYCK